MGWLFQLLLCSSFVRRRLWFASIKVTSLFVRLLVYIYPLRAHARTHPANPVRYYKIGKSARAAQDQGVGTRFSTRATLLYTGILRSLGASYGKVVRACDDGRGVCVSAAAAAATMVVAVRDHPPLDRGACLPACLLPAMVAGYLRW